MERKCTCCSYPSLCCELCPLTQNYWTSLPQGFVISSSGTSSPIVTEERIREIIKEELEKSKTDNKPKNCGIVGTIKIEADVESFKKAAECVEPETKTSGLSFEKALTALKAEMWVTRTDWNGNGQRVCMMKGNKDTMLISKPFLLLYNAQGEFIPWVPSMGDLFSNKWKILNSIN